jgi:hypothetical protein
VLARLLGKDEQRAAIEEGIALSPWPEVKGVFVGG